MRLLNAATELNSLRVPPGNRLEQLVGSRAGQHSIRINDQYRICFVWLDNGAGGGGVALLPTYWQTIGGLLPPRHAVELFRNVRYFDGHNIAAPIAVLLGYRLVSLVIIVVMARRGTAPDTAGSGVGAQPSGRRRIVPKDLIAPVAFSLILTTLFAFNYMSSGHEPVAQNMPFGVVGSTSLAEAAQGDLLSLDIIKYDRASCDRGHGPG